MKAYLIPGNGEDLKTRDYAAVLKVYKSLGYDPKFVPIQWRYRTIDDWIAQVESKIPKKDIQNSLLSGFSYGSMIALGIAAKTSPKKLLLFSLSPYFKEDTPFPAKYYKWHGKRRMKNFENFSFDRLAKRIHCPNLLFIGSKEQVKYKDIAQRSADASRKLKHNQLIVVKDAGHDVADPKYIEVIKKALT